MESVLGADSRRIGRLCVYACGRTRGAGPLLQEDVRDLLQRQSVGFSGIPVAGRALHPESLVASVREEILREARRRQLINPGPHRSPDPAQTTEIGWDVRNI